jgi:hypothetical protein
MARDTILEELDALALRIERLATAPELIEKPFYHYTRPIWRVFPVDKPLVIDEIGELLHRLSRAKPHRMHVVVAAVETCTDELQANVNQIEIEVVLGRAVSLSLVRWLRRVYELLYRLAGALDQQRHIRAIRIGRLHEPVTFMLPLALAHADTASGDFVVPKGDTREPEDIIEQANIRLQAADHMLCRSFEESTTLERRRSLMRISRQMLLDLAASHPLDQALLDHRLQALSDEIGLLNAMEAHGVRPRADLVHQARQFHERGERALSALSIELRARSAAQAGDEAALTSSLDALDQLPAVKTDWWSSANVLGTASAEAASRGVARGRDTSKEQLGSDLNNEMLQRHVVDYFAPRCERTLLNQTMRVDGLLEGGDHRSAGRVTMSGVRQSIVPYPTKEATLEPAKTPADIPGSQFTDPRTVIADFAANKLLKTKFIDEHVATGDFSGKPVSVRIYLMDGSSSMYSYSDTVVGARAKMRDGILIAELSTLYERLRKERDRASLLFYAFFSDELGPFHRVDTPADCLQHIESVAGTVRHGGTALEEALIASFGLLRELNQAGELRLERAHITLVTDGLAPVSSAAVENARRATGGLPVGVSVIALGLQNRALREIVAFQRAEGEHSFYHFISDSRLGAMENSDLALAARVGVQAVATPTVGSEGWTRHVDELLEDLVALDRQQAARGAAAGATEGDLARRELALRDFDSLRRRFNRWFPTSVNADAATEMTADLERAVRLVGMVLKAIIEALELLDATEGERQADALELLDSLLPTVQCSPTVYLQLVGDGHASLAALMSDIHGAARWGILRRIKR